MDDETRTTTTPTDTWRSGSEQPADDVAAVDQTAGTTASDAGADAGRSATAREWMGQLQAMIDNLATHAAPVMREIGAKAAELAAVAGEKAGPIAQKAAEVTAQAGAKVAERGREVAAELRRDQGDGEGAGAGMADPTGTTTIPTTTGSTASRGATTTAGTEPDRADALGE